MIYFFTHSTNHLLEELNKQKHNYKIADYQLNKFCDNELLVQINQDIKDKEVTIISSTQEPSDIIEVCLLLDICNRNNAKINLFFTYFSYARQITLINQSQALSSKVICNFFKQFNINKIFILHPHSLKLQEFLTFQPVLPYEIYYPLIKEVDVIIAADKGATDVCKKIASDYFKSFSTLEKVRISNGNVKILELNGDVKNKNVVIVDDIIATGNTIVEATNFLFEQGAKKVDVIATHGVFCKDAIERLEQSKINKIYVTNSLNQKIKSKKIKVLDISNFILNNSK